MQRGGASSRRASSTVLPNVCHDFVSSYACWCCCLQVLHTGPAYSADRNANRYVVRVDFCIAPIAPKRLSVWAMSRLRELANIWESRCNLCLCTRKVTASFVATLSLIDRTWSCIAVRSLEARFRAGARIPNWFRIASKLRSLGL